ncbi:MAG: hypothetical protein KAX55_05955 [Propionivibrio sp.]|jgi:hypothetical protein|uniref:Transmembrane protein n=1 Tax=Stenotrophomonas acidaminiphila TaxID=128780 RepID=A0A0S1AZV3_9GAMM|nr:MULTISPECIES: hypothetical protein [Gammaproteobacteria]MBP6215924.1 hypothetical protein [Luteimonas sp.]MBP8276416.1 hypothetical protein [Propionivibrio sp.]OZB67408.1 MAG: hypothetical protein B7X39_05400 [Xanthomonadales bacterium 14-68-21]ALJ28235.1 hypothetical protein AOT14_18580 [Stenotrophomonas acidaminiphila]MBL8257461.1 hypothetical protein [Pseudoxanthomonas mexicana]
MKQHIVDRRDALSGILLLVLGLLTMGTAVFFLVLRPALLPEDIRHTGIDPGTLPPAFLEWLGTVFRTWGGFIAGFGVLLLGIGGFLLSGRARCLYWATAIGAVVAFGRFLFSNILLDSDFLWFISALFALAAATAISLLLRRGR